MTIVYLIYLLLVSYFSYRYDCIEEEDTHKNHRFWFMCVYLICLSGFSYGLGADKFVYMDEFEMYPDDFSNLSEIVTSGFLYRSQMPGWVILNMIAKSIFGSFYAVQFIVSIFINVSVFNFIKQYTHRYFLFLIVYFLSFTYFIFNTEVMREAIALSFVLYGYSFYMKGKRIYYGLMILLGFLFHLSAIFAILLPLAKAKFKPTLFYIALCTSFAIWLSSDSVARFIVSRVSGTGRLFEKIVIYSFLSSTIFGFLSTALRLMVFPFVAMYYSILWEENEERQKKKSVFYSFTLIIVVFACALVGLQRMQNYVQIFSLIAFSDFLYHLFKKGNHQGLRLMTTIGMVGLIIIQGAYFWPKTKIHYFQLWYPYTTIGTEYTDVTYREQAHSEATSNEYDEKTTRSIDY